MGTMNFQMFKLDLGKAEEPEVKLPTSVGSQKKQESSRKNIYFCFIDCAKALDYVDHNKLGNILKAWECFSNPSTKASEGFSLLWVHSFILA